MKDLKEILKLAIEKQASDIFIVAGRPVAYRFHHELVNAPDSERLMPADTKTLLEQIYALTFNRPMDHLLNEGDDDFSFALEGVSRFRVSAFKQRGSLAAVIRAIPFSLPEPSALHIPQSVINFGQLTKGMVLITGPAASGKSTTLACIIDSINHTRNDHIITLEDPIEFLHRHDRSIVSQREIDLDTESYVTALRAALRQSPDVILLGEMRDYETISVAMTAAETGHLIFSTLHTLGASNTINRIIDVFPPEQQHQIAIQLSTVLSAVISQQLVPTTDGSILPVFEIMTITPAIANMIREGKVYQLDSQIHSSSDHAGMVSMDDSLLDLYKKGTITAESAIRYALRPELMKPKVKL